MRRLLVLALVVLAMSGAGALSTSTASAGLPPSWPALLNDPDVDGNGAVSIGDINQVVQHFGTSVVLDTDGFYIPGPNYHLLYDVNGGGAVSISDINTVVNSFGTIADPVETQVAQAALATMAYNDWSAAQAAAYSPQTQYVADMGIHVSNNAYAATFDHTAPIGLIYKQNGGTPDELIGLWYVVPNQSVCDVFLPGQTCSDPEPEGFAGPEDNTDMSAVQRGWHNHVNLCFIPGPPPLVVELGPPGEPPVDRDHQCTKLGGIFNFADYGWMVHLYTEIPNPNGRFMMWNYQNLP